MELWKTEGWGNEARCQRAHDVILVVPLKLRSAAEADSPATPLGIVLLHKRFPLLRALAKQAVALSKPSSCKQPGIECRDCTLQRNSSLGIRIAMADMMVDGDRVESPGEQWAEAQPKEESDEPEDLSDGASVDQGGRRVGLAHVQKRRRVTRACDECRRKKIKCDGKQPCVHCTVYSYSEAMGCRFRRRANKC